MKIETNIAKKPEYAIVLTFEEGEARQLLAFLGSLSERACSQAANDLYALLKYNLEAIDHGEVI